MTIDRRRVLHNLAALGGSAMLARVARASTTQPLPDYPFRLGVAAGFPTDHSVILWTRLAPDPTQPEAMPSMDWSVAYEVAADEKFRRIVARGEAIAPAALAHSVHQEVRGLSPGRHYWYRFTAGGHASPVGRLRTLPAPQAKVAGLRIALASCQHYEHGHYAALRHIADDAPDMVLHVGDYIYEGAPTTGHVRLHTGVRCVTLEDYRQRHALYKLDPALQAAHHAAAFFLTWDDHDLQNDYAGDTPGRVEDIDIFPARRAAAYQAWYEHLPLPPAMAPGADGRMRIYNRVQLGRLATLHLLDGRQYRSPEACAQPPKLGGVRAGDDCLERLDYRRTVLGLQQEQWLEQGLQQEAARWTLLAQGTVVAHMDQDPSERREYWTDGWTGYPAARQRLVETLQRTRAPNPVMLSGDIHAYIVAGLNAVPEDPDTPLVAGEFVTTSISSDPVAASVLEEWRAANPRFHRLDGSRRGYTLLDLSEQRLRADLVAVDDRDRPDSGRRAAGSYVMEAGHPAIHPA